MTYIKLFHHPAVEWLSEDIKLLKKNLSLDKLLETNRPEEPKK